MTVRTVDAVRHPLSVSIHPGALDDLEGLRVIEARSDEEVVDLLRDGVEVLITHAWRDEFLQPSLRWVQGEGAGYEQYPLDELAARGVVLTTARGVHACVAEMAVGLLLAMTRGIARSVREGGDRRWSPPPPGDRGSWELAGSTVGILGLGAIGEQVARRLVGWEVELIGCKRDPSSYRGVVPRVVAAGDLRALCEEVDVLISTVPGSADNVALLGAAEFEALGEAWFVNVGRGRVVDEPALVEALTRGRLRGAGLDVFSVEPLPPSSPLWTLDHVVITPHSGGRTHRYAQRLIEIVAANLVVFQAMTGHDHLPLSLRGVDEEGGRRAGEVGREGGVDPASGAPDAVGWINRVV